MWVQATLSGLVANTDGTQLADQAGFNYRCV